MDKTFFDGLGAKFPVESLETHRKNFGNRVKEFTYIKVQDVIRRWNEVTAGKGYFSWRVLTPIKEMFFGDDIVVMGQLSFTYLNIAKVGESVQFVDGPTKVVEQIGGARITRAFQPIKDKDLNVLTKAGDPICLDFDIKAAIADAFKKCSTMFGVGLYLYDGEERESPIPLQKTLEQAAQITATGNGHAPIKSTPEEDANPILATQVAAITNILKTKNIPLADFLKRHQVADVQQLSKTRAGVLIVELQHS